MSTDNRSVMALVGEIARYLDEHPNAADSVEGIVRWWLPRQRLADRAEAVQVALEVLVAENKVTSTTTADGQIVYRRAEHAAHNDDDDGD